MHLVLQPTDTLVQLTEADTGRSVRVRKWRGRDDQGVPVHCYVALVAVHEREPADVHARFAARLREVSAPAAAQPPEAMEVLLW